MGKTAGAARSSRKGTEDADNSADRMNEIFSLLSNQRRRYALYACDASEEPLSVSDLAEKVAAREYGKRREMLEYDERKRVYTAMTQTHLPAMEEAGVVDYDGREVRLTDRAEEIEVYMDVVPSGSLPWSYYYLGLSLISALVLGGVRAGVYPDFVPDLFWAGLVVVLFGVSSAYHAYRSREMRLSSVEEPYQAWEDT